MAVRTWVGRFCVADGEVREEGPWLGSLIREGADDEADELYVLIEPASPASAEFTSQLVDVITQLYHKDPLSLTGALTRSLRAAHEHLREWNRSSLKEHQVGAGASCLALRGRDAYLAQAGRGVAYVRSADGELRRIMAEETDFDHALGVAEEFEPLLTRIRLKPGDLVLVASSAIDATLAQSHVERILARGPDEALAELYLLCRDIPDFALVLLSCFEAAPESPPDFLTHDGGVPAGSALPLDDAPSAPDAALVGSGVAGGPDVAEASLAVNAADGLILPPRPIHEQVREIHESTAPSPSTGVRLRGDGATPRYRRSTGLSALPQFQIPKLALVAVAALAILGLLAYAYIPGSVKQSREDKFTALVAAARESNARAQATGDAAAKRQMLVEAGAKLNDASKIHKDSADVATLRADVKSALGVLDAVFEIKEFTTVADLPQVVTGSLSVTHAILGGGDAYLLDTKGKRVLRVPLNGSGPPETILQEGQPGGFFVAGKPVQISWSEQTQTLTMIDDKRQAFGFTAGGAKPLTVRGVEGIGSVDAITSSGGNLYVLDVKQNQVWRYLPGQSGFDSERTALFDNADLQNATELAVGQDIYLLDTKLGVRRFAGKAEGSFPLAGIDTPMMSPASIAVLPGSNRIVIADRGNKRVIVASADGLFLRQIVSPAFTDLRAVAVDEGASIIYVLNGDTLLKAPFPP
ncbi:MAG: hypothetical protein M3P30_00865 [Chloroflexota bacterium]|nr:hypothetical protein [Chloroflexota bacterium]